MKNLMTLTTVVALLTIALLTSNASATVVADWQGDYGATGNWTPDGSAFAFQGSANTWYTDTPISPAGTTSYSAPAGKSETFYGGYALYSDDGDVIERAMVANDGGPDMLNMWAGGAATGTNELVGVYVFNKADFLNGGDSLTVQLDASSSFQVGASAGNNANFGVNFHRIVVNQGGTFYISNGTEFSPQADPQSATTVAFNDLTWQEYDPATAGDLRPSVAGGAAYGGPFDDVQAIGVYVETVRTNDYALRNEMGVFTADVTVPEPATMGLLAMGGLALIRRRRS